MEIVNFSSNITPLSTSYAGDSDVGFNGFLDNCEEDISIYRENYLKNSVNKINNYSSLYLSDKRKLSDFLNLKRLSDDSSSQTFSTTIQNLSNGYLTIDVDSGPDLFEPVFRTDEELLFTDLTKNIFEITLLDSISARITHKSKNRDIYSLIYNESGEDFRFSKIDGDGTIFNYVLDKNNNMLSLFKPINGNVKRLIVENDKLKLNSDIIGFQTDYFKVNYYIQQLDTKFNTSWVSYEDRHKNIYKVNSNKSVKDLENNYLVTTQYSYITGNTLESNILILKNQKTNKNYSYRSNYLEKNNKDVPVVDNRAYYGLFTGNEQEKGNYNIVLGYEFYNADYKFEADKYNVFKTPKSLYPYNRININDLDWNNRGAIAGENPHTSDKIFKNKDVNNSNDGEYLCSWLRKEKNGNSIWLDRYYYPEKTSFAVALQSKVTYSFPDPISETLAQKLSVNEYYDIPFVYNTLDEESEHTPQRVKDAIYGSAFFDKRSDIALEPNTEYIYHRIGNDYVLQILDTIKDELLINGLDLKTSKNVSISIDGDVDEVEYVLNNDSYTRIENYTEINETHQFTICFWLQSDDWTKGFGHQILGNLNDRGFALLDDEKITPFITIQTDKKVLLYNTNFELLDTASLDNEEDDRINSSKIKDIYRTEHLNGFYTLNID